MKVKTILFDLDGTLMPLSNDVFEKVYISSLAQKIAPYYDSKKLVAALWEATSKMVKNNDYVTNETVFYQEFGKIIGEDMLEKLQPVFDEYYEKDFVVLKQHIGNNEIMVEAIRLLKEAGYQLIIATNPMFPKAAINKRIEWSGLNRDDFSYVTYFENQHYCKPNVAYFEEIIAQNQLDPKACLMVGNDMQEDMIVRKLGMKGWILTEYLINREDMDGGCEWKGTRPEFLEKVKRELL